MLLVSFLHSWERPFASLIPQPQCMEVPGMEEQGHLQVPLRGPG